MTRGYAVRAVATLALLSAGGCGLLTSNHVTVGADDPADETLAGAGAESAGRGGAAAGDGTHGGGSAGSSNTGVAGEANADVDCADAVPVDGDVAVYWPAEVEALPLMKHIAGNLTIHQAAADLSPFRCLESVAGNFDVGLTTELSSLDQLGRLRSIGKSLRITGNQALRSLAGLSSLSSVGANLEVEDNPVLLELNGLERLTTLGDVSLRDNAALGSLTGLAAVERVEALAIVENSALASLDGLALTHATSLTLTDNTQLVQIEALSSLTEMPEDFAIDVERNDHLLSLDGLEHLAVLGDLTVNGNAALQSVAGLAGVRSAGAVSVKDNAALPTLDGLDLQRADSLTVTGNVNLVQVDALSSLTTVRDTISIRDNARLGSLELGGLTRASTLDIGGNSSLVSLAGLAGLTAIDTLWLSARSLTSLEGLHHVTHLGSAELDAPLADLSGLRKVASAVWLTLIDTKVHDLSGLGEARIADSLVLRDNEELDSLSGLAPNQRLGLLQIGGSPKLGDLAGLEALESANELYIVNNVTLSSLNGLDNLSAIGGYEFRDNPQLPTCAITALLVRCGAEGGGQIVGNDDEAACD